MKCGKRVVLLMAALLGQPAVTAVAHAEKCEMPPSIRFSMIPLRDVEEDIRRRQPLFARISELTGRPVQVVRPTSYNAVVEGLLRGSIDVAELGPATYVDAKRNDNQITAFATTARRKGVFLDGYPHYQAVLAVLAKSVYKNVLSLKGARLALTDPGSTSGSVLPHLRFAGQIGVPLESYFGSVSYSGSHANSVTALARGDVDAAFISSAQLEDANRSGKLPAKDVKLLWHSEPLPYDPVVYRGRLCEPLRKQIQKAFVGQDAAAELRELLESMNAERFVAADDSMYSGIRTLLDKAGK